MFAQGNYSFLTRRPRRIEKCTNNQVFLAVVLGVCLAYTFAIFCVYIKKTRDFMSERNSTVHFECQEATESDLR